MPHPAPRQVISASATAQAAAQPDLPSNEEPLVFLLFLLSQEVGGIGKELQGKPLSCARRHGTGPVPLLSGWRGAMGVGSGTTGQDGIVEVCCRLGLR